MLARHGFVPPFLPNKKLPFLLAFGFAAPRRTTASQSGWPSSWSVGPSAPWSTKRWLLRICAVRDQMPYALRMVAEMEARGEDLFAPLNDLVHACHRVNQIDDEALRLWEEGGRLEGSRLEGGVLESWKGDVAPGTLVLPGLLFKDKPDR